MLKESEEAFMKKEKKLKHGMKEPEYPRYEPKPSAGLSREQVAERMEAGLVNVVSEETSQTAGKIICSNIFTYFNLIFFIIAVFLIMVGSYNNLTFLVVVFINMIIGIVQELKSKKELDKLKLVSAPETTVIRDGKRMQIPSSQLVLDDIVIFSAGNQICADAVVCAGELTVNESLVTGESDEIKKQAGDSLLSGSFAISGQVVAKLEKVGDACFVAQLARDAKKIKKKQQPGMMKSLTRLIQIIGVTIIPFAVLMFWNQHRVLGMSDKISVENTAASIIGMIPEGLYLLTSVALVASTIRLARRKTLVHDMKCIETLARVDVLCVDKTGTITEPQMNVEQLIPLDGREEEACHQQISEFVRSMNADNSTMKALKAYFGNQLPGRRAVRVKGFSSATKYSALDFGAAGAYVLGAPEIVAAQPSAELDSQIALHSSQGQRVLLFAEYTYEKDSDEDIFRDGHLGAGVTPVALVILSNAIRPQAKETFSYFQDQGVSIKVISGDNPVTAAMAAQKAGIPNSEHYIDATVLESEEDVAKAAMEYTVFGRVTPEQKRQLIRAIKKSGHTVAMTGDGVNDVLALKDADCSIAMASGSEAAANVSDLVLMDSDFSGMPQVVAEGRRVINNIERSASLFLVKNIFSFILSLISLISVSLYPLKPGQISLVSALMIGVPSFFLTLEPNHNLVRGKFLRNVMYRALPAALTAVILVVWTLLFGDAFGIAPEMVSTVSFLLYAFAAYLMLYRVCKPMNRWHGILFGTMGVAFVGAAVVFSGWFQISPLDFGSTLILVTLLMLTLPLDYMLQKLFTKMEKWKEWVKESLGKVF